MRVFKEEQAFRQWWLILILGILMLICAIPIVNWKAEVQWNPWNFLAFSLMFLIALLFWTLRLKTRIDAYGITARFTPFNSFKRHYNWKEIENCYVREYAPISEYGGWGIRGFGKAIAYNVSGNMGIQIVTTNGEKFLIGTNKPTEAEKVIDHFMQKQN
ncbi:hypothetical protein [Christiangramia sabulilitoris]|uniref:Uncharacterized protein n=1 Tax=Christiangramia sabulilitoris TaxID=2583991 RepID=A0A550I340_9FLAO|nr:hypothetical protein [Christiangramia sabulilitoris]TRO65386.1 hypothetical protein FGM01_08230 [Christiangramia sabulilitoris]